MFAPQTAETWDSHAPEADAAPAESRRAHATWRQRLAQFDRRNFDLVHDLAEDIGSRRWLRGFATLGALVLTALAFWPNFALEAAPAMHADTAVRDGYRSQMLLPQGQTKISARLAIVGPAVATLASVPERPRITLTAVVAAGDSFMRLLERAGVSSEDAARAAATVASRVPLGDITPGTRVEIVLGPRAAPQAPRGLESLGLRARFDTDLLLTRQDGAFALTSRAIAIDTTPLRIRGVVGPSLYRSARAAGAPADAIQQYLQALDGHLSLEGDIQPGDSFDIIMAYKRSAAGEAQAGQVLYAGLDRGSAPVAELMRWGGDNAFFAADALTRPVVTTETSGLMMPVAGRITSNFGPRFHPILGYTRMHSGVDIGASWGTPIRASAAGVVSFAGRHGGHGNYVRLDHGGGLGTGYGHMSSIAVWNGTRVSAGQVIGYVGSTGISTGPHLHYEMYDSGRTVNPLGSRLAITSSVVNQVDPKQVAAFKAKLAALKKIRPGPQAGNLAMTRGGTLALR